MNPKTLRYWEEIGLLPQPPRNASGYRDYPESFVDLCRFILKAKRLGFKLSEIKEILDLKLSGREPCGCVREKIRKKVEEIDSIIEDLRRRKALLLSLVERERNGPAPVCPIIESDVELENEPPGLLVPYGEQVPSPREAEEYEEGPS
ncbi:MAG: MerR family DNA-binding protein [Aquificota bacterium]|nr:MerR family DNA-binding protein [Aquificota bacterium]